MGRAAAAVGLAALVTSLVGCTGDGDDAEGLDDRRDASARPVANEDHWHAAFGVYVCDRFVPPIPEFHDTIGIHTHGDGVIHIHPFSAEAAGERATLRVFLDGADIDVSDDELTIDGDTYTEGEDTCGDQQGEIVVVRWADFLADEAEPERTDVDTRFRRDGEGYVVAFVPEGAAILKPETAVPLEDLGVGGSGTGDVTATTTPRDDAGEDEPPATTDDRSLTDGFYPVEATEPAPCRTPGMRPDMEREYCHRLPDEPAVRTDVVEEAEASLTAASGRWEVAVTLTANGVVAFNDVAAGCVALSASCPLGQLALVVDDDIVMAPTITESSFERDEIVVSGEFTEDEAKSLADALAG